MSATTAAPAAPVEEQADAQPRTWARAQEIAWAARAMNLRDTPDKRYYRCLEQHHQDLYFDLVKLYATPNVERVDGGVRTSFLQIAGRLYPDATDLTSRRKKTSSLGRWMKALAKAGFIEHRPHTSSGGKSLGIIVWLLPVPELESIVPAGVAQSVRADDAEGWL